MNGNNENLAITYSRVGDYNLPNLVLPIEKRIYSFGKYGRMRLTYLKEHRRVLYVNLLTSGKLNEHLREVDEQANSMVEEIVRDMAGRDKTDEALKATDQMKWVGLMNNYRSCASEVVMRELIQS